MSRRIEPAYVLIAAVSLTGLVGAVITLVASGMHLRADQAGPAALVVLALFAAHAIYALIRHDRRLALLTGGVAFLIMTSINAAIVAHAGLRLRRPLIDFALARADSAMGFDTPGVVVLVSKAPVLADVLGFIYSTTVPAVFATVITLCLAQRVRQLWQFLFVYGSGALVSAACAVGFPAFANFVHGDLTPDKVPGLPDGSGRFFLASVDYFRNGTSTVFDAARMSGVVTFPSFHAVMALAVAYAARPYAALTPWVYGWAALVLISTVPIGGHYLVDVAGGAMLFLLLVRIAGPAGRSAGAAAERSLNGARRLPAT